MFEQAAARIDLTGTASVNFPIASSFSAAAFVGEAEPIRVAQGDFDGMQLGPVRKIALIGALSNELEFASGDAAASIISQVLEVTVGKGLNAILFSASAASAVAPAGLLYGVTPLTVTVGGGLNAMVGDLKNLVVAVADAGIDAEVRGVHCRASTKRGVEAAGRPAFQSQDHRREH